MPDASIVIVTRNRKGKAIQAVRSAFSQSGNNEVILMDDGSTDGTSEFIRTEFPQIIIYRSEQQEGYIVHRTRSGELARSPMIVSIDDDAVFADTEVVAQTLKMFDHPLIGAVAIPHVNHYSDGRGVPWWPDLPDKEHTYIVRGFVGTAYAVRVDLFRQLGGFHNDLFHWGEEMDYCQRLYGAGYVVRLSSAGLIRHYPEGIGKYPRKVNRYIFRNQILTGWMNAPFLYLFPITAVVAGRALLRLRGGPLEFFMAVEGMLMAFGAMFTGRNPRRPISSRRYRTWMEIRKRGMAPLDEMAGKLSAD